MFSEGLSVDLHASEGATVRSSGESAGFRNSIRQHSQRCLAGPNAVILAEEQATRKSAFLRGSRRPSSAVVETEFGLSRPQPQRQGLLLLRRTVPLGRAEFLFSLPRIFLLFSFPPIAASVASLWLKFHDSRSARRVSTAGSASGGSVFDLQRASFFSLCAVAGFRIRMKMRARRCADCAGASNPLLRARRLMVATIACGIQLERETGK
jgi:hypothetical protein